MAPKNHHSSSAELSLVHLQRCLVNLPPSLVSLLMSLDTPAQNLIVELSFRAGSSSSGGVQQSVYVGWTGMPSKRKVAPAIPREGTIGARGSAATREQDVALVEIDSVLATALGLRDGQRVDVILHHDPPLAHTVSIEPLTPEDWELIELHATFLEFNFLNQIRALPNPTHLNSSGATVEPHLLVLHLSPTSTAKVRVSSLEPAPPADCPFAKIAPEAEVIVAPKSRAKPQRSGRENRSVTSTSKKSGKSGASTVRGKNAREDRTAVLYLRPIDRKLCGDLFADSADDQSLAIWVEAESLLTSKFKGVQWAKVSILQPAASQASKTAPKSSGAAAVARTLIAQLRPWDDPPSGHSAALSTSLAAALDCEGIVGGVVKIEPATPRIPRGGRLDTGDGARNSLQRLIIHPFAPLTSAISGSIKFGGESKAEQERASAAITRMYGDGAGALLNGPLVDGMLLPAYDSLDSPAGWAGGLLRFNGQPLSSTAPTSWILGSEWHLPLEVQSASPRPTPSTDQEFSYRLPGTDTQLVGVENLLGQLHTQLMHMSSILLTGGLGSGKSAIAQSLAQELMMGQFFHVAYLACTRLINDESRVSTIKEALHQVFTQANWASRLGGSSLVILDDLDKLCPAETELQVGNDNSRSRQVSETVCSVIRQYCGRQSQVVVLATAQSKDSLNNVIIASHVVRDIVDIKAPDKETRRRMLEAFVLKDSSLSTKKIADATGQRNGSRPTTADGSVASMDDNGWMDTSSRTGKLDTDPAPGQSGFLVDPGLDFLELAGLTDGYMPADLHLLNARARNEALIRSISEEAVAESSESVELIRDDFDKALVGFTPAALRNVALQTSTVTFQSIGGLEETRRVLLETLQYPTKYAPLFEQCPLRLRSGLLLYGYPGCGKTLLASAVAGECGLNFISVKGPEILNKYIGASEKAVRDLFERAQAARPCVLFFDEFDSIAPKRGHDSTGVTDRVVNQLLTQMDGAEGLSSGVYVLAATSRPDLIDPALLRPGRLDKALLCDFPNLRERVDILRALAKQVKLSADVLDSEDDLLNLARRTDGFSGADIQALLANAQLEAIHEVLDSDHGQGAMSRGTVPKSSESKRLAPLASKRIVQFHYGADEPAPGAKLPAATSKSSEVAEQAALLAKLESIKLAHRRARQARAAGNDASAFANGAASAAELDKDSGREVVIGWKHLISALATTKASISAEERRRLERIYHEFVVGRSGEMRDGQASMEIGGRSSLM